MTRRKQGLDNPNEKLLSQPTGHTQMATQSYESKWSARNLLSTPMAQQRKTINSVSLNSNSAIRKYLFELKKRMIVQPLRNITITLLTGFLINLHFILSIVIIYEKIGNNLLSYSKSIIPMISLSALILLLCISSLVILMSDLITKGCVSWHRDSIGLLMQKIIFALCMLITFTQLFQYVKILELEDKLCQENEKQMTLIGCLIPLMVFVCLSFLKMLFFKMRNIWLWLSMALCTISASVILSLKFDYAQDNIPIFVISIPIVILLFTFTSYQVYLITFVKDQNMKLLYGLDQKYKILVTIISCCVTICFIISITISLFLIQIRSESQEDIQAIVQFILLISFIYFIIQMDSIGVMVLEIFFEQFNFDLISDSTILAKSRQLQFLSHNQRKPSINTNYEKERSKSQENGFKHEKSNSVMKIQITQKVTTPIYKTIDLKKPLLPNNGDDESPNNKNE